MFTVHHGTVNRPAVQWCWDGRTSLKSPSHNNKNLFKTESYWYEKIFKSYQKSLDRQTKQKRRQKPEFLMKKKVIIIIFHTYLERKNENRSKTHHKSTKEL